MEKHPHRIVKRRAFQVMGRVEAIPLKKKTVELPRFWERCRMDGSLRALEKAGGPVMGIGSDGKPDGTFDYMIGVHRTGKLRPGWEVWSIPAGTWAVFDPVPSVPGLVGPLWEYIFGDFLARGLYQHAGTPDLEVNLSREDGDWCEVWVPLTLPEGIWR